MGLLRLRLRAERRRAARWISAILLLALAGGAALVSAQAARRTDTAFTRNLAAGNASDAVISANAAGYDQKQTDQLRASGLRILDALDRSPLIAEHGRYGGITLARVDHGKIDGRLNASSAFGLMALDDRVGRTMPNPRVYSGRLAAPDRADEITVTRETAKRLRLHVGSRVTDLRAYDWADLDEHGSPRVDRGDHLRLRVVGIVEFPEELLTTPSERELRVYLTPAFARTHMQAIFYVMDWVRLRHGGADVPALRAAAAKANRLDPTVQLPVAPTTEQLVKVNRANDPLVNGLWMLAALFGLVGVLLAAQSLGRSLSARADEHAQLRALGATRRQRLSMELATLAGLAVAAAAFAGALAFVFSPITPIGAARDAEPHPGFSVNLALTLAAIASIIAGTLVATLPALWRLVRATELPGAAITLDQRQRRSRAADVIARSGLGPSATVGTQLALQPGRGSSATPVRSVLASLILVVATVTATFAFGVNLQRWTTTPQLYGWNWDAAVGTNFGTVPPDFEQPIEHFPHVVAAAALNVGQIVVDGRTIPAIGTASIRGDVGPEVDAGRLPADTREIVLGAKTMRTLHKQIGNEIDATAAGKHAKLRIVGRATFAAFGTERGALTGLGVGALGTVARFPTFDQATPGGRYNYILVRFAPGTAAKGEQQLREVLAKNGCADPSCVLVDSRPAEIDGYRNARRLPLVIGIVLVLLLVATLTHVLVSTMRRRTGDLAVLRALGCTPRNLVATMCWQSLVLTGTALAIGIPLGLVADNLAWRAFSRQLGIAPGTVAPFSTLTIAAVAVLVLAAMLATAVGSRVPRLTRRHRLAN